MGVSEGNERNERKREQKMKKIKDLHLSFFCELTTLVDTHEEMSIVRFCFVRANCDEGDLSKLIPHLNGWPAEQIGDIRDGFSATSIDHTARDGHEKILRYFIEKKGWNAIQLLTEHGATCLHDAAVCDQLSTLIYLLDHSRKDSIENALGHSRRSREQSSSFRYDLSLFVILIVLRLSLRHTDRSNALNIC